MNTKDADFVETFKSKLIELVKAQQYSEATKLLNRARVGQEPEAWKGTICEELGDHFYSIDKAAAAWLYTESLRWLEKFAAGATDSADAMSRNSAGASVDEKLQYLRSGAAWPYKTEIPEDVVLRNFLRWAESSVLNDFVRRELTNQKWSTQAARVLALLKDRHTSPEMLYELAYIPLRLYGSYSDPTGILASWLRVALPRLAAQQVFKPEFEDMCRNVARAKAPASIEIAGLVNDYLRAADEAPARDAEGNRRQRSLLASAPSTEEDLVENLLDLARQRSSLDKKLRGLRVDSTALRSRFYAEFLDHCSAAEACEMIFLLVSEGQRPQDPAADVLERWAKALFDAIQRRKLRAPDMVRHCFQGLVGKDFSQGLRREIVNFLLTYGSNLAGFRKQVIGAFGYDLYSAGTYHPMTLPATPKTWREWEHEAWATCDGEWPVAVLLFALDPPAEREMFKLLEAPLDSHKPSPMFLPSLVLFHLWNVTRLSVDGLRAVARHMEIARRMDHSSFLYLYDRAVLVFHKWWPLQPAIQDAEVLRASAEVAKAIAALEAGMLPETN